MSQPPKSNQMTRYQPEISGDSMDNKIIYIIKTYPHEKNQVKVVKITILQKGGRILEGWTSYEAS